MSTLLLAWLMALPGFAALALGMERHQRYLAPGKPGRRAIHGVRLAGALLLALSLSMCVARWQPSLGAAIWLGVITFAALVLGLIFTYCARKVCLGLLVAALCLGGAVAVASI